MARAPRRSEESLAGIPLKAGDLGLRSVNDGQTENVYAEHLRFLGPAETPVRMSFAWLAARTLAEEPSHAIRQRQKFLTVPTSCRATCMMADSMSVLP
jgi:hypothetical protein